MKIYIKYETTQLIETNNFSSINSIINKYIQHNNLDSSYCSSDDFYVDYNGIYLNRNYSLEKYNITDGNTIQLHKVIKGGSNFFSFAVKNYFLVFVVFLIAFLPVIILPLGIIPSIGNLIKVIIDKSVDQVGKYLICVLGKKTLFKRFKFLIYLIKYVIFILMIYIVITFPLVLLCVTLKGQSIFDSPKSICGGVSTGKTAGTILTMIYVGIFLTMRAAKLIFGPIIYLFKKNYYTNMLFNPIFKFLLGIFESIKYIPINLFYPFNAFFVPYFSFLTLSVPAFKIILTMLSKLGCSKLSPSGMIPELKKQLASFTDSIKKSNEGGKENGKENGKKDEKETEEKMKALLEKIQGDRLNSLHSVDQILLNISSASDEALILEAYKTGANMLNELLPNVKDVDDAVDRLHEVMADHDEVTQAFNQNNLNIDFDEELDKELKALLDQQEYKSPLSSTKEVKEITEKLSEIQMRPDRKELSDQSKTSNRVPESA